MRVEPGWGQDKEDDEPSKQRQTSARTDRQRGRQTDRETEKDRQTDRQTGRGCLWLNSESRAGMQKRVGVGAGAFRVSQDRLRNKSKIKRKRR